MLVKAVKLISGEELVGEVIHEEDGTVTMKNPLAIVMSRTQTGDLNVGFVPFAPYLGKDASFDFTPDRMIFIKEVDDQMKNQYTSIFGGIVTPPKQILMG